MKTSNLLVCVYFYQYKAFLVKIKTKQNFLCHPDESKASDIQDWDSLEFVNIIVAVMQTFNIKFSIEDLRQLKNIGQMVDLILQRIN